MQSLSEKKHKALIAALRQLEELSDNRRGEPMCLPKSENDIRDLEALFVRYQELMTELGDCITAYENLYKDLKTNVLAPQFRSIRHQIDQRSLEYHILKRHLVAVRSY